MLIQLAIYCNFNNEHGLKDIRMNMMINNDEESSQTQTWHARIFRPFSLHGRLSGERDDSPPPLPLNDLLGSLVCLAVSQPPISICSLSLFWHFYWFCFEIRSLFTSENKKFIYLFILLLINYLSISNPSVFVLSFHWSSIVRTEIDWEVITTDLTKKIVGTHRRLKRSAALIKI